MGFLSIDVNLNRRCSLRCRYCFFGQAVKADPYEMEPRTMLAAIQFCKEQLDPAGKIHFFGVEPLVSFSLLHQFVDLTAHYGFRYGVTTNAVGLNPTVIDFLLAHDFFILTSYDGLWHDRFRVLPDGRGSSVIVERHLEALAARGYRLHIATSMVPGEEPNFFPSIVQTYYRFNPVMIAMNKIVDSYTGKYDPEALRQQFVFLARWYKSIGGDQARPPFALQFIRKTIETRWPRSRRDRFTCGAGHGSISVDADGRVFPCYRLFAYPEYQLGDVWSGIDSRRLEAWRALDTAKCHECRVMPCSTCYGENLAATGSLTEPNPESCVYQTALMAACMEVFAWKPDYGDTAR